MLLSTVYCWSYYCYSQYVANHSILLVTVCYWAQYTVDHSTAIHSTLLTTAYCWWQYGRWSQYNAGAQWLGSPKIVDRKKQPFVTHRPCIINDLNATELPHVDVFLSFVLYCKPNPLEESGLSLRAKPQRAEIVCLTFCKPLGVS